MFNQKPKSETQLLDEMIENAHSEAAHFDVESDEMSAALKNLAEMYKIKNSVVEKTDRFTKDQMLAVAGNLAGILAIIGYERVHVISSKALGFVIKAKS
jgi:hypothetical protein